MFHLDVRGHSCAGCFLSTCGRHTPPSFSQLNPWKPCRPCAEGWSCRLIAPRGVSRSICRGEGTPNVNHSKSQSPKRRRATWSEAHTCHDSSDLNDRTWYVAPTSNVATLQKVTVTWPMLRQIVRTFKALPAYIGMPLKDKNWSDTGSSRLNQEVCFTPFFSKFLRTRSDTLQREGSRGASIVVSFSPPRDHDTCPSSLKQARDMWPFLESLNMSPRPIQTPSSSGG